MSNEHTVPHPHDRGYRLLFSHPEFVEDLLRGFVREPWVEELDFSSLERLPEAYVSYGLDDRHGDLVWKVRWREQTLYVYLVLEFQSTDERFMALRLLVYIVLLYQELIRRGDLLPGDLLPPVLPLLLYNGERPWTAPLTLRELIAEVPPSLAHYLPDLRYFLLDERRLPMADLSREPNLVAGLVQLERSAGLEDVPGVLEQMLPGIRGAEHRHVRRAIASWLRARLPAAEISEDLLELTVMLEENVKKWLREREEMGRQRGEADLLLRQADRKFGGLDETQRARIESADSEQLLEWGERLLNARRPEDLFAT
jgi:Putative transposase, YhgA-like/Domain of unknown function (DUF4351)